MHNFNTAVSGVVKAGSGQIYHIHITKVGTGASSVTIYDNPAAAAGNIIWTGDGLTETDFDMTNGSGQGSPASTGIYVALAGTANPTVSISYD